MAKDSDRSRKSRDRRAGERWPRILTAENQSALPFCAFSSISHDSVSTSESSAAAFIPSTSARASRTLAR